jgi:hypothetical protein
VFSFVCVIGETDLVEKVVGKDVALLSSTHVMEGSGRMLVVGVGLNSQIGNMMSLTGAAATDKSVDKKSKEKKSKTEKTRQVTNEDTSNPSKLIVKVDEEAKAAAVSDDAIDDDSPSGSDGSKHRCKTICVSSLIVNKIGDCLFQLFYK